MDVEIVTIKQCKLHAILKLLILKQVLQLYTLSNKTDIKFKSKNTKTLVRKHIVLL
jgi:hypothetical protein